MTGIPSIELRKTIDIEVIKNYTKLGTENKIQIQYVQLDPNGLCNAKCWFCPVAYEGNPEKIKTNMPIEMMENILKQLADGRGDFVKDDMQLIVPYNFNEVLLYPHFEDMLKLFKKYNFVMPISTNGVNLTKSKIDLIKQYPEVVKTILLNVPSAFPDEWAKQTGFNIKLFDKVINNIKYAVEELPFLINENRIKFIFNHFDNNSTDKNTGWATLLDLPVDIDLDINNGTSAKTVNRFAELFPEIKTVQHHEVLDRLGFFERIGIFTNAEYIKRDIRKNKTKIVGCDFDGDSQTENSLHINADGSVHLCCQDFNMESIYFNIKDKTIKEIWHSQERRNAIEEAYKTFCQDCQYAVWE